MVKKIPPDSKENSNPAIVPHGWVAMAMHWGFIVVFVYALTKQLDEVEELADFSLLQYEMVFATVFLFLLIGRFLYMQTTRPSALPDNTPLREKRLARAVHLAMYVSLSLIAITGLAIGGLYWSGQRASTMMNLVLVLHEIAINTSFFLILGHIAAAFYHRRKRDGMWDTMVPVWKEPGSQ